MPELPRAPRAPQEHTNTTRPGAALRGWLFVALLVAGVCLFSLWGYGRLVVYFYQPEQPGRLSGQTQTQCVGRYLMETPVELGRFFSNDANFRYGPDSDAPSVHVTTYFYPLTAEQFEAQARDRIDWLQKHPHVAQKTPLLLAQQAWQTAQGKAYLLRYLDIESKGDAEFDPDPDLRSELHLLVGTRYVIAVGSALTSARASEAASMEARLRSIAGHIQPYAEAASAPAGFCLDGLVMDDKTMGYVQEMARFTLLSADPVWQRSQFSLAMQGPAPGRAAPFTERVAQESAAANWQSVREGSGLQIVELRQRPRSIDAMPGLEYAEGGHPKFAVHWALQWESQWAPAGPSLQRPALAFSVRLGDPDANAPLDKDQALRLWDGMLGSLRLAPANGGAVR